MFYVPLFWLKICCGIKFYKRIPKNIQLEISFQKLKNKLKQNLIGKIPFSFDDL